MKPSMELEEGRPSSFSTSCGVVALAMASAADEELDFFSEQTFADSTRWPEEPDDDEDLYPDDGDDKLPLELDFWKGNLDLLLLLDDDDG